MNCSQIWTAIYVTLRHQALSAYVLGMSCRHQSMEHVNLVLSSLLRIDVVGLTQVYVFLMMILVSVLVQCKRENVCLLVLQLWRRQ